MISVLKVKMKRHQFDALNIALQQYIPNFIASNQCDIMHQDRAHRDVLLRRVIISLVDDMSYTFLRLSDREAEKSISLKLSEAEVITLYFLLQQIPVSPGHVFTSVVITDLINELHQFLVKPFVPQRGPAGRLAIENY